MRARFIPVLQKISRRYIPVIKSRVKDIHAEQLRELHAEGLFARAVGDELRPADAADEQIPAQLQLLERHAGLFSYETKCIRARTREGVVTVTGENLTIAFFGAQDMLIQGRIAGVQWENAL